MKTTTGVFLNVSYEGQRRRTSVDRCKASFTQKFRKWTHLGVKACVSVVSVMQPVSYHLAGAAQCWV